MRLLPLGVKTFEDRNDSLGLSVEDCGHDGTARAAISPVDKLASTPAGIIAARDTGRRTPARAK